MNIPNMETIGGRENEIQAHYAGNRARTCTPMDATILSLLGIGSVAMKRKIIETIKREYVNGNYRYNITDLPWEIHFRLGCRWEEANEIANDIRIGEKIMNKNCYCNQCTGMDDFVK